MVNIEEISTVALSIITYAGVAKSCYLQALRFCKVGNKTAMKEKHIEGDDSFSLAHKAHGDLLKREMKDNDPQISLLMAHAEDQLMSCETIKIMSEELEELYTLLGGK